MPRGRPPKNNNVIVFNDVLSVPKNNKNKTKKNKRSKINHVPLLNDIDSHDPLNNFMNQSNNPDHIIEVKRRGRKKGRNKKEELDYKPDDVIDYMIRNFPYMGIEKIKDRVLDGLKTKKIMDETPYMLSKFLHNGIVHYYDDYGTILNSDCVVVGYFVKNDDGSESKYMIDLNKKDNRSFQEVIDHIESL